MYIPNAMVNKIYPSVVDKKKYWLKVWTLLYLTIAKDYIKVLYVSKQLN